VRVLVVHNRRRSVTPSGEDRVVDTETHALRGAGHHITTFERHSDEIAALPAWRRAAVPVTVVWNPAVRRSFVAELEQSRPDVVHVHNTFPLLSGAVLRAAAAADVPVVVTIHNYRLACSRGEFFRDGAVCHDCAGRSGLPAVVHGCYRGSRIASVPVVLGAVADARCWRDLPAAYIFVSDWQRRALRALGLPEDRCHVKWNCVPPRTIDQASGLRRDRVVYMGRLDEAKGIRLLMAAWTRFSSTGTAGTHPRLAVAGSGALLPEIRAWAIGRDDVDLLGLLDPAACHRLVTGARVVVVPSAWEETFGLAVVEAMAAGVPTIAAAHGALPELIRDGTDGVLFRPGDPGDLARRLRELATDPDACRRLGAMAQRGYRERFDPGDNLERLLDIYRFAQEHPRSGIGRG